MDSLIFFSHRCRFHICSARSLCGAVSAEPNYICSPGSWVAALVSESSDSDLRSLQQLQATTAHSNNLNRLVVPRRSSAQAAKHAVEERSTAVARNSAVRSPSSFSEPKRLRSSRSFKTGHNLRSSPNANVSVRGSGILSVQHSPTTPLRIRLRRVTTPPPQNSNSRAKRTLFRSGDGGSSELRFALASPVESELTPVPKRACVEQLEKLDFSPVGPSDERRAHPEAPSTKTLPNGHTASIALNGGRSSHRDSKTAAATGIGAQVPAHNAALMPNEDHDENWILAEVVSHEAIDDRIIYTIFDIDSEDSDGYTLKCLLF